ncbi:MAG: adenosine kinase [Gammaproteobacteria bacterium]|jgi:sugar/nucleoside kinase (ribokinase family)
MSSAVQLLGVSNAIVDILSHVDHGFLERIGADPGTMTLIDEARADEVYGLMGPATEKSGGSVANSVAVFAGLGGSAAYIGRVADDQFGRVFQHDMDSLGIEMRVPPSPAEKSTARCYVLITPDGQRTMQTYLGACTELGLDDVTAGTVGEPGIVLLEGYIWDLPQGPAVADLAISTVRANGGRVALSLSDALCVERHRPAFRELVEEQVDIVFADEEEIYRLFATDSLEGAVSEAAMLEGLFVITRSANGSVVVNGDEFIEQAAFPVERVVDTTGAGDTYTAAFLASLVKGESLDRCARIASWCGARVIQQVGARYQGDILAGYHEA